MNKFEKFINKRLFQWIEGGLLQQTFKWEVENVKSEPLKSDDMNNVRKDGTHFNRLTFGMYRLLSIFYSFGVIIATLSFLLELRYRKIVITI